MFEVLIHKISVLIDLVTSVVTVVTELWGQLLCQNTTEELLVFPFTAQRKTQAVWFTEMYIQA